MTNKRMEITRKSFEQIPFWTELTEEEKQLIQRNAFLRRYEKGAFVYGGAVECLGMLLLLKGRLRTSLLSDEGREVTLFNLHPGEICVLSASCIISEITFDTGMTAEKVSDILVIPSGIIDCLQSRNIHVKWRLGDSRMSCGPCSRLCLKGSTSVLQDFLLRSMKEPE